MLFLGLSVVANRLRFADVTSGKVSGHLPSPMSINVIVLLLLTAHCGIDVCGLTADHCYPAISLWKDKSIHSAKVYLPHYRIFK